MLTCSLQSGSNGNSIYVEADGVRLLFDAGISARQAAQRLARHGRRFRDVQALFISHDHSDHVGCAGVYHRAVGMPIYITKGAFRAAARQMGPVRTVRHFRPGESIRFGAATVHTLPTPHDAADAVAFIVEAGGRRLGIFTDLGHVFDGLPEALRSVDAAYLESNYDPDMLEDGPYPPDLKERIRGGRGHLSNQQAAELLRASRPARFNWVALAHLSEENNDPDLALRTHRAVAGDEFPLLIASRYGVSPLLPVGGT